MPLPQRSFRSTAVLLLLSGIALAALLHHRRALSLPRISNDSTEQAEPQSRAVGFQELDQLERDQSIENGNPIALMSASVPADVDVDRNVKGDAVEVRIANEVTAATVPEPFKGIDIDGRLHFIGQSEGCRAVVMVFLGTQCPIANEALPELNRLHGEVTARNVEMYGVVSAPSVSRREAIQHRDDFAVSFPVLFDATGELRQRLQATHSPHAFVLSADGRVLYSGAIDDQFPSVGRRRREAAHHFVREALADALAGRSVRVSRTDPVGCLLEQRLLTNSGEATVTFAREVASVIHTNCVACHRPDAAGPFSLLTYEDVRKHAAQIRVMVELRLMPPWKAEHGFGHFRNEMILTDAEVKLITDWIAAGLPRGRVDDEPAPPVFEDGWQFGQPDLVIEVPEAFVVPADGPDIYRYFVIPSGLVEDRLVSAIEYRPGQSDLVHHASFRFDDAENARRLDDADPGPGYQRDGGWGFETGGTLGGWATGIMPQRMPNGFGRPIKAGSDIVIQTHYHPNGRSAADRGKLGLYFAPRSATRRVEEIFVANTRLSIPPDERSFIHRAEYVLPVDATVYAALPHTHLLGRKVESIAELPDGRIEPLIRITDWDFSWQAHYFFEQPLRFPAGTRIMLTVEFDNSVFNPLNSFNPPRRITWGEATTAEMAVCFFDVSTDTEENLDELIRHNRRYIADQGFVP